MVGDNISYREDINAKDPLQEEEINIQGIKRRQDTDSKEESLYKIRLEEKGRGQTKQSMIRSWSLFCEWQKALSGF